MGSALRSTLIGTKESEPRAYRRLALALGAFVTTFTAYTLGLFDVSGGLVWIPFHAALVGMIAGCWIGYSQRGLLFAWMVTYTSLLGYHGSDTVSQLSGLAEQLAYFLSLDGLGFFAIEAVVLGTLAYILGFFLRLGIHLFRREAPLTSASRD